MLLSVLTILTFYLHVSTNTEFKKHVQNSVYPYDMEQPTYDIESWVKQLHLQQCAFVEVGDKYYAIFVETRPRTYDQEKGIREYFLGLCDDDTLSKWSFCSSNLQKKRGTDCAFYMNNMYGARVHRRLCDVTLLALNAPQCDCNNDLSDSKLLKVQGFPTCFKAPLPDSLCGDNNVCGLSSCVPETINKRVHTVRCDRSCHHQQPFCEPPDKKSSEPRHISSFWTDWSNPFCTDVSCLSQFDEATCINSETAKGDIDCLGPGTSCCTPDLQNCRCHVYEEEGVAKVFRTFSIPPPELVEYMSEEDFINNIPLRYLNKEEYHKYPDRKIRSDVGKAVKKTIYEIYDHRPIKFGNRYRTDRRIFHPLKKTIMKTLNPTTKRRKKRNFRLPHKHEILFTIRIKPEVIDQTKAKRLEFKSDKQLTYNLDKINNYNRILARRVTKETGPPFKEVVEIRTFPLTTASTTENQNITTQLNSDNEQCTESNELSTSDDANKPTCTDDTTTKNPEECVTNKNETNSCEESTSENSKESANKNCTGFNEQCNEVKSSTAKNREFIQDELDLEENLEYNNTKNQESEENDDIKSVSESSENIALRETLYTRNYITPDENDNYGEDLAVDLIKRHKPSSNARWDEDEDDSAYANMHTTIPTNFVIYEPIPAADEDQDEDVHYNLTGNTDETDRQGASINLQSFRHYKRDARDEEIFEDDDDMVDDGKDEDIMIEYGEVLTTKRTKSSTIHEKGEYNNENSLVENEFMLNKENGNDTVNNKPSTNNANIFNIDYIYYIILILHLYAKNIIV